MLYWIQKPKGQLPQYSLSWNSLEDHRIRTGSLKGKRWSSKASRTLGQKDPFPHQFYWGIYNWQSCMYISTYKKRTKWWSMYIFWYDYHNPLINTFATSHSYVCGCGCGENTKVYPGKKFQVYNTALLTTVTILCFRSPEFIRTVSGIRVPFDPQPFATTIPLSVCVSLTFLFFIFLDSNYKWESEIMQY